MTKTSIKILNVNARDGRMEAKSTLLKYCYSHADHMADNYTPVPFHAVAAVWLIQLGQSLVLLTPYSPPS